MRRSALGTMAFLTAAAVGLTAASPATAAQAQPTVSHHAAVSVTPPAVRWHFTGETYPDTAAGLAACNARGQYWQEHGALSWACNLDDPDANVYNLWLANLYGH